MRTKLNKNPLVLCALLCLAPVTAWADTLRPELMTLYDFHGGARMPRDSVPRVDTIR